MKKRSWPEEIDWIRQQDQKMYFLINVLSVAAALFLVCVVAHRAAAFQARPDVQAGTETFLADAAADMIRLASSGRHAAVADASLQDAEQTAADLSGAEGTDAVWTDGQTDGNDGLLAVQETTDTERKPVGTSGGGYDAAVPEGGGAALAGFGNIARTARDAVEDYDCRSVRGQPDYAADSSAYAKLWEKRLC